MVDRFLKAKHWQLFLLTFGIPFIFQMYNLVSMGTSMMEYSEPDPMGMFNYMKYFPVIMVLYVAVLFGWYWSVVMGLQSKVPAHLTMKIKKFKIFFFIPLVYILLISLFITRVFSGVFEIGMEDPDIAFFGMIAIVIVPLHLFSMFCIFYTMYFIAKTIKTVEFQREVRFSDFVGEFFLIWFYPVGIWILQPKINKMVEGDDQMIF